jgi:hypothetical protein
MAAGWRRMRWCGTVPECVPIGSWGTGLLWLGAKARCGAGAPSEEITCLSKTPNAINPMSWKTRTRSLLRGPQVRPSTRPGRRTRTQGLLLNSRATESVFGARGMAADALTATTACVGRPRGRSYLDAPSSAYRVAAEGRHRHARAGVETRHAHALDTRPASPSRGQAAGAGRVCGGWTVTVSSDGIRIHRIG